MCGRRSGPSFAAMTVIAPPPPAVRDPRSRLVAGLRGSVLEVGAGTGTNFALYPPGVTDVLAVEPHARRRDAARRAAARVPVTVIDGVAEHLPVGDATVDAVVVSLVLCSVRDVPAALAEFRRVLRPGAELRFFEHVIAERGALRALQRVTGPVWSRIPGGCHPDRDTVAAIVAAGFTLEEVDTVATGPGDLPAAPRVVGRARS